MILFVICCRVPVGRCWMFGWWSVGRSCAIHGVLLLVCGCVVGWVAIWYGVCLGVCWLCGVIRVLVGDFWIFWV